MQPLHEIWNWLVEQADAIGLAVYHRADGNTYLYDEVTWDRANRIPGGREQGILYHVLLKKKPDGTIVPDPKFEDRLREALKRGEKRREMYRKIAEAIQAC